MSICAHAGLLVVRVRDKLSAMDQDTAKLEADIAAARAAYQDADGHLQRLTGAVWIDGPSAAEWLINVAEEQGAERAVQHMLGNVEGLGPLSPRATDSQVADMSDTLEDALERLLVAQDRLDVATSKREAALRSSDPSRRVVVNFGGREFVIDTRRGELRSVDNPDERYRLADDAITPNLAPPSKPSLTEQIARDAGTSPAQPVPPHDKIRSR